jgi:hypothetical protein
LEVKTKNVKLHYEVSKHFSQAWKQYNLFL